MPGPGQVQVAMFSSWIMVICRPTQGHKLGRQDHQSSRGTRDDLDCLPLKQKEKVTDNKQTGPFELLLSWFMP